MVSSVLRPNDLLRREAVEVLEAKAKDAKVRHWPGPLAQFVLNQIDEGTLNERSMEHLSKKISPRRKWQIDFYRHVLELERALVSPTEFREMMGALVDTSRPQWSNHEDFTQLVRNPEFYIARHEIAIGKNLAAAR